MRIIAIVFNFSAILIFIILFIVQLFESGSKGEDLVPLLILIWPISNLIALIGSKDNNWLSLYIKRKMLEEEKKIEELTKHKADTLKGGN